MAHIRYKLLKIIPTAIIVILIALLITYRATLKAPVRADSPEIVVMNTMAKIIAIGPDKQTAQKAIDAAAKKIKYLESIMNRYDPDSQLSQVNQLAAKHPVKIDKDLFSIIEQSIHYGKITDGAFDITVAPLIDLWKQCAEANSLPTEAQLAEVKNKIGSEKIILDTNDLTVRFVADGMKLDLGAIAKGFAFDMVIGEMKNCGAIGGLVDIGGDIGCFGLTDKNTKWLVGVQNPSELSDGPIMKLALTDSAVATSGDYRRFYTIKGRHFSHIFNPATEQSADVLSSVTVIAPTGAAADALATAVSVLGAEKGLQLIESLPDTEAIIIKTDDRQTFHTSGAGKYISK